MDPKRTFRAVIEDAGGGSAFVRVPFDVEQVFGSKRPRVEAVIDGQPYRGTLVRMGGPEHILIVLKEIREKSGKGFGDPVEVTLVADNRPRTVEVPADFRQALDGDPPAQAAFEKLSYTHQREYVRAVTEAKQEATRRRRIARNIDLLKRK